MTLTIEVPEKVVERAEALGIPVNTLVEKALEQIVSEQSPTDQGEADAATRRRVEATRGIREIASRNTLGGLKIKDLIEEGRRL